MNKNYNQKIKTIYDPKNEFIIEQKSIQMINQFKNNNSQTVPLIEIYERVIL